MKKEVFILDKMEVEKRLNSYLLNYIELPEYMEVKKIKPTELLSPNRIDVLAKYYYAKSSLDNTFNSFASELYDEHLRVFNNYIEEDYSGKIGINAFRSAFHNIQDSIRVEGFLDNISLIPVNEENVILDGAHRLAAALAFDKDIFTVKIPSTTTPNYNYIYFKDRLLNSKYLDFMAQQYALLKTNTFIIVAYPTIKGCYKKINTVLDKNGSIIYEKEITLSNIGEKNLIIQLYRGEKWLGTPYNSFAGADSKVSSCFSTKGPIKVYLFEANNKDEITRIKKELRSLFDVGNHSIHINDTHQQTIELTKLFFNKNSIHYLNYAQNWDNVKFWDLFNRYSQKINLNKNLNFDDLCVDSGAVMGAYGLRNPADLDYLSRDEINNFGDYDSGISNHNNILHFHNKKIEELIYNPNNYFYINSYKFLTLQNVLDMKKRRGEKKDIKDIEKIISIIGKEDEKKINHDYSELLDSFQKKKIIFFGTGKYSEQLVRIFPYEISYFIDNNINKIGKEYFGKTILEVKNILKENIEDIIVIIASSYFKEISEQLERLGLISYENYFNGEFIKNISYYTGPLIRSFNYNGIKVFYKRGDSLLKQISDDVYEKQLSEKIVEVLQKYTNPVLLDIGANIGLISTYSLSNVDNLKVFAFEPGKNQYELFNKTINENHLQNRIKIYNNALGDKCEDVNFYIHSHEDSSGDGLVDTNRAGETKEVIVRMLTGDSWWKKEGNPRINSIKIDVEGAELYVLKGLEKTIKKCRPVIFFEYHELNIKQYPYSVQDLWEFFINIEYDLFSLDNKAIDSELKITLYDTIMARPKKEL